MTIGEETSVELILIYGVDVSVVEICVSAEGRVIALISEPVSGTGLSSSF